MASSHCKYYDNGAIKELEVTVRLMADDGIDKSPQEIVAELNAEAIPAYLKGDRLHVPTGILLYDQLIDSVIFTYRPSY